MQRDKIFDNADVKLTELAIYQGGKMKTLTEFKNQNIQEDGHTDVPSAMQSLKVMSESISEIETALSSMSERDSLGIMVDEQNKFCKRKIGIMQITSSIQ